jgi:methionyl aminopeptidase
MDKEKILRAGKIASQIREYAKSFIKKDVSLLEIANKIESKIIELGGRPAFPTNLSINDIAAHYTPIYNDETKAHGLLKVDFGIHINGWISDTAFSVDLEDSEENKKIIGASEKALENALSIIKKGLRVSEIGKTVQETINSFGLNPIINLSGHQIEQYELHAGINIPNIDDKRNEVFEEGLYAIEPFATNGAGKIRDGKPSGIYMLISERNIRNPFAREILEYLIEEYQTLPFCSRWIVNKFGTKTLIALKQLEDNGNLHQFKQLIEVAGGVVSQAEHTVFLSENEKIITTKQS